MLSGPLRSARQGKPETHGLDLIVVDGGSISR